MMESVQIDFFGTLDRASDTRKPNLCRTWENAVLNDCGVFVEGMRTFEAKAKKGCRSVEIHCAMEYPKVYYTFGAIGETAGFGSYPGRNDQNFDVHEHAANVMLMVEHSLMRHFEEKTLMAKLAQEALEMMEKAIKEGMTENESDFPICKTCGEKFLGLLKDGNCVYCDYKREHPDAQKLYCKDCIHFRNHATYDENDTSECSCRCHLSGSNDEEWSYTCKDYFPIKDVIFKKSDMEYETYGKDVKCDSCKKKKRFVINGMGGKFCLDCFNKKMMEVT